MVSGSTSTRGLAYEAFGLVAALVEEMDSSGELDCDVSEGAVKIEKDGIVYLISWHEPSSQVWVASPRSGSVRFVYSEDRELWIDEQGRGELMDFVKEEVGVLFGLSLK